MAQKIPHSCLGTAADSGWQGRLKCVFSSSAAESTVCNGFPRVRVVILIALDLLCRYQVYIYIENKGEYMLQYVAT